jgi:hypothetical protein
LNPLTPNTPMFLVPLSNWAILVMLEAISGGLRILFEFHKQETMCENSTSSFAIFKCLLIGLSTLPSLSTLYNIVNLCSTLHYSNSVLKHRGCWMHLCVGVKFFFIMANEIAGFGDLNLFIFVISSDLIIIRYIIRLGRFVRILKDQMEMVGRDCYLQIWAKQGCV